ncbi:MAG: elongation factor P 5-aminopentanone reductase [Roseburia sp.]
MNKTVLVTGASRGIGRAVAAAFAQTGCRLVITCAHSGSALTEAAAEFEEKYRVPVLAELCDVSDYNAVEALFSHIESRFGGVDILVNNAGISHIGLLQDMTIEAWNHIVATNLTSVFSTCKLAIPHMLRQEVPDAASPGQSRGKIINISSVWGNVGASCEVAYSATKGGINAFTRALAKELAPSSIQVNAIACGVIDTRMNACFSPEERNALAEEIPAGRFGRAEEVAALALQLATGNDYLTGQIITLDGGWI